jgi:hypothetical protein
MLALKDMSNVISSIHEKVTYKDPSESINPTHRLTRGCIFRPLRRCKGRRIPSVTSIKSMTAPWAYESLICIDILRQLPALGGSRRFIKKKLIGWHVNKTNMKVTTVIMIVIASTKYRLYRCSRSLTIPKSVRAKEILINPVPRTYVSSLRKKSYIV